jgi:hypothetical protein
MGTLSGGNQWEVRGGERMKGESIAGMYEKLIMNPIKIAIKIKREYGGEKKVIDG